MEKAYVLGTDKAEMHRLGFQHQVWAKQAYAGWERGGFTWGQQLLDLGCGPGFTTKALAYLVGPEGKVIGVDQSATYLEFLDHVASLHRLPIETQCSSFNEMSLDATSLDGAYCRWALAWVSNPEEVVQKVIDALKPGGTFVAHEYFDWMEVFTQLPKSNIKSSLEAVIKSYDDEGGDIDIGRRLPTILGKKGMEVMSVTPLTRIARPGEWAWHWPKTFLHLYLPKLVEQGRITKEMCDGALNEWTELEDVEGAYCFTPPMLEVVAKKK